MTVFYNSRVLFFRLSKTIPSSKTVGGVTSKTKLRKEKKVKSMTTDLGQMKDSYLLHESPPYKIHTRLSNFFAKVGVLGLRYNFLEILRHSKKNSLLQNSRLDSEALKSPKN